MGVTVVINSDLLSSVGPDDGAPTTCECMSGEWEADSTALVADLELITALYAAPGLVDGLISRLAEMFGIPLLARPFAYSGPEAYASRSPSDDVRLDRPTRPDAHMTVYQHYDHLNEPDYDSPGGNAEDPGPRSLQCAELAD